MLSSSDVVLNLFEGIREIPAFDLDREMAGESSPAVDAFRQAIREAESVVISSPEYAHGVPGSLKNALDWVVGSGELSGKPVALLDAAPHSGFARAQLHEILRTMYARVLDPVTLAGIPRGSSAESIAARPEAAAAMRAMLDALAGIGGWTTSVS